MRNLNELGVQEMSTQEMKDENGGAGVIGGAWSAFCLMYALDFAINFEDHVAAFKEGYNAGRN